MRALVLILTLSFANFAQASMQFSDLSTKQQNGILTGLQKFLPMYKNALEIAIHNIQLQSVGSMDAGSPMSEIVLEKDSAEGIFTKVEKMFGNKISMRQFDNMRGIQTFSQASQEAARAESLSFHVHHKNGGSAKAWMKHMNKQVEVITADENGAAVRILGFPRKCTITADSSAQVRQHCN